MEEGGARDGLGLKDGPCDLFGIGIVEWVTVRWNDVCTVQKDT